MELRRLFDSLAPWRSRDGDLDDREWANYVNVARSVQQTSPEVVKDALAQFMRDANAARFEGYEISSKPFLLMRVVFDLPESAPESSRRSFKGWTNWPAPDDSGNVSLSWPVSWSTGQPRLVADYTGSEGKPYAAVEEYHYLLNHFVYRKL